MRIKDIIDMKTIAYYRGVGGLEIKGFEYGVNDYAYCISGAWHGKPSAHRVKINFKADGSPFIRVHGYRIPLSECLVV